MAAGNRRFDVPDWDGPCELIISAKTGWTPETVRQPVTVRREWKLMLTSDKPVYQPGQEIHLRSLALGRMDLKPAAEPGGDVHRHRPEGERHLQTPRADQQVRHHRRGLSAGS